MTAVDSREDRSVAVAAQCDAFDRNTRPASTFILSRDGHGAVGVAFRTTCG
jgi:hypothetical protein